MGNNCKLQRRVVFPALINTTLLMKLLEVKNRDNFRSYDSGYLYVHLLALRVNTSDCSDVIVTDYSGNQDVVSERSRVNMFGGHELPRDQLLDLQIPLNVLRTLCLEYAASTNDKALFETATDDTNWIDVSTQFCLLCIEVKLRKTVNKLTGTITKARVVDVDTTPDIAGFWERFMCLPLCDVPDQMSFKPSDLIKRLQGNTPETQLDKSMEAPVKIENLDSEIDSQQNLEDILEPASQFSQVNRGRDIASAQPVIHGLPLLLALDQSQQSQPVIQNTQFLTQVPPSQTQGSNNEDGEYPILFTLDSNGSLKSDYTLAELGEIAVQPDNRVYSTLAFVAGTIPSISYVVSKAFKIHNGEPILIDPETSFLELVLADIDPSAQGDKITLPQANTLSVHIPPGEILAFFGVRFVEDLYIKLPAIEEQLHKRVPHKIPVQLILSDTTGGCAWVPQNLTIDDLF